MERIQTQEKEEKKENVKDKNVDLIWEYNRLCLMNQILNGISRDNQKLN